MTAGRLSFPAQCPVRAGTVDTQRAHPEQAVLSSFASTANFFAFASLLHDAAAPQFSAAPDALFP